MFLSNWWVIYRDWFICPYFNFRQKNFNYRPIFQIKNDVMGGIDGHQVKSGVAPKFVRHIQGFGKGTEL